MQIQAAFEVVEVLTVGLASGPTCTMLSGVLPNVPATRRTWEDSADPTPGEVQEMSDAQRSRMVVLARLTILGTTSVHPTRRAAPHAGVRH